MLRQQACAFAGDRNAGEPGAVSASLLQVSQEGSHVEIQ